MLMLKIMEKVAAKLHNGDKIEKGHLTLIIEFLKNFADRCHHGKEEDILFPELLKNPSNEKIINDLLGEHKSGRDFIRGMEESMQNYKEGNPDAVHIAVNMEGYIRLLTDHIRKENSIAFPLADKQFSEQLQREISEKFETLEQEVIGEGKHEEYHGWLKELTKIYL